jgi:hypothetical protein
METNEEKGQQGDVSSEPPRTGSGKNWKTAIFVLVVLAVAAVGAHSVLTNGNAAGPCSIVCGPGKVAANNPACTVEKKMCTKETVCASENKTCEKAKLRTKDTHCPHSKQAINCPLSNQEKPAPSCCPKAAANTGSK